MEHHDHHYHSVPPQPRLSGPGRARRAIFAVAKACGLATVFGFATVGGVLIHAGFRAPREFALAEVNEILAGSFKGRIEIGKIDSLRLDRLSGVDADVFDPDGERVIHVEGVSARFGTLIILRSLFGGKNLKIDIPKLSIESAEVLVQEDATGELTLLRAFESPEPESAPSSRGTEVALSDIRLEHAWIHGSMAAVKHIDVDLDGLQGRFALTPETTTIDVAQLGVEARDLEALSPEAPVDVEARVEAHVYLPEKDSERRIAGRLEGWVGEVPVSAEGSWIGDAVEAVLDVPRTSAEAVNALSPGQIQLSAEVMLHAQVQGELPNLVGSAHAELGPGSIDASAAITVPRGDERGLAGAAQLTVKNLDAALALPTAPDTNLSATLDAVVLSRPGGALSGNFALQNDAGLAAGQVVPPAVVKGTFTEKAVRGRAEIAESGAPTSIDFAFSPRDEVATTPSLINFRVETTVKDLESVPRLGPIGDGSAGLFAEGLVDLETKTLDVRADAHGDALVVSGISVGHAGLTATAKGPLEAPRFDAKLNGTGLALAGYAFNHFELGAAGVPETFAVSAAMNGDVRTPAIVASASVSTKNQLAILGTHLLVARQDVAANIDVGSVSIAGSDIDIRGVRVQGLGKPLAADVRLSGSTISLKARTEDLDLELATRLVAKEEDTRGHLALDVDAIGSSDQARGKVDLDLKDLHFRGIEGGDIHLQSQLEGRQMHGQLKLDMAEVGEVALDFPQLTLGGPLFSAVGWSKASGKVDAQGNVDIDHLIKRLPRAYQPDQIFSGKIVLKGSVSRKPGQLYPTADLNLDTDRLMLAGAVVSKKQADGSVLIGAEPWRVTGIDGAVHLTFDGTTNATEIAANLHDQKSQLASIDLKAAPPVQQLLANLDGAKSILLGVPIEAHLTVPRRSLGSLPKQIGVLPIEGEAELTADISGTAQNPRLKLKAKGTGLRAKNGPKCALAIDLGANATYDGKALDVRLDGESGGRKVLDGHVAMAIDVGQVIAGAAPAWEASAEVDLDRLPLEPLNTLINQPIGGKVSGKVSITNLHKNANLDAKLQLENLAVDRAIIPKGSLAVSMKGGSFDALARLDEKDGHFQVKATGAMAWGDALAPSFDLNKTVEVALDAKNFRIDAARPFVEGTLSELDGRIDTDAKVKIEQGGKTGSVVGNFAIHGGVVEAPQLGERFHDIEGQLTMDPWGTVKLSKFTAQAPTGHLTASAEAVLSGFSLKTASAKINIPKGESVPIALEGVPMGRAFGDIEVKATMAADSKRLDIKVDVPTLGVDLPQSSGNSVQDLEPDKNVSIGFRDQSSGQFVTVAMKKPEEPRDGSSMVVKADIKLGKNIQIKRDTTVDVSLGGNVSVEVSDKTHVTGQIRVARGKIELQGKIFTIDRGIVSFVGDDPGNPLIQATAYWDAADKTRVYADFSGFVSQGKLRLRSEPSLTQDQILSLLLFGSADGSFGAAAPPGQEESTAVEGVGVAGGVVTQGLNKIISGVTKANISTRIDSSEANNPQPQIVMQITHNINASLGYKLGVPAPGDNPDRAILTVDWRFIKNWSLDTAIGDQGSTGVDVVWRLRY